MDDKELSARGDDIMADIAAVFSGCSFEVGAPSDLDPEGRFAVRGSLRNAALLLETVMAKSIYGTERFHWSRKGMVLDQDGFYVHYKASDDVGSQQTGSSNDKELSALKALAEAATPGIWNAVAWETHAVTTIKSSEDGNVVAEVSIDGRDISESESNSAFIAAANPQVILSLISRVEQAEAEARQCRAQGGDTCVDVLLRELLGIADSNRRGVAERVKDMRKLILAFKEKRADISAATSSKPADGEIPAVLFDGKAVYDDVQAHARCSTRTSLENVSDTLEAVVRLMRKSGAGGVAGAGDVKTWQDHYESPVVLNTTSFMVAQIQARDAEIADLRVQLAHQQAPVSDSVDTPALWALLNARDETIRRNDTDGCDQTNSAIIAHITAWKDAQLARERQGEPKLRHSETYVSDLEDSLRQIADELGVKDGADDLIAAVKKMAAPQAQGEPVAMLSGALNHARDALRFYAEQQHFRMHQPDEWDTVSGEPQNFYEDANNTATVEDGSVAKRALEDIAHVEAHATACTMPAEQADEGGRK